jgi:hypothetical protein
VERFVIRAVDLPPQPSFICRLTVGQKFQPRKRIRLGRIVFQRFAKVSTLCAQN